MHQSSSPWKSLTNTIYQSINKTPEKKINSELLSDGSPLPNTFRFTPTKGKKLYPHLNPPDQKISIQMNSSPTHDFNESYINKENQSFVNAMDTLQRQLFSSNISNKVMDEFSSRYEKVREEKITAIQDFNNSTTNEELNRRASGRFSSQHRNRFNRMESIAFHYAAKRSEKEKIKNKNVNNNNNTNNNMQRKLVQSNELQLNDNISLTPGDKRFNIKPLESASKRLRLDENTFKEIDSSPTKSLYEKEQIKNIYSHNENIPSYLQPTKASLQKSNSSRSISPSKSSNFLSKRLDEVYPTPDLKPNNSSLSRGISRSPSISPTRIKTGLSKLSPSRAVSNLNEILTSSPEKPIEPKFVKPQTNLNIPKSSKLPRSKTISNSSEMRTSSIPKSKTSNVSYKNEILSNSSSIPSNIRNISTSSSIPRLAKLASVESRVRQVSKHSDDSNNNLSPKKWRY